MTNKQQLEQDDQHFNWTELDFKQDPYFSDVCDKLIVIKKAKWKKSDKKHQELFVLLHGLNGNPDNLDSIATKIFNLQEFHDPTILVPKLPTKWNSFTQPEIIARDLVFIIDELDKKYQFKDIYLIGYSLGSLIARKVYLYAYGEVKDPKDGTIKAPFDNIKDIDKLKEQKKWVKKINRLILLAGMNKGWSRIRLQKWFVLLGNDFVTILDTVFTPIF